jgi:hypothetical protein
MLNIRGLKAFLVDLESTWTEEDKEYLGEFEDQIVYVDYFKPNGFYAGLGHGKCWFTAEFGLMFTQEEVSREKEIEIHSD